MRWVRVLQLLPIIIQHSSLTTQVVKLLDGGFMKKTKTNTITIYSLYEIDKYGRTTFHGRYGSRHRMKNAVAGLGLSRWFFESEEKIDQYSRTRTL